MSVNLLNRKGLGETAQYANSTEAGTFLVQGSDMYIGDAFILSHDRWGLGLPRDGGGF